MKGKTFEYHYTSFPIAVQQQLGLYQAEQPHSQVNEPRRHYTTEVSSIENTQAEDHIPIPFMPVLVPSRLLQKQTNTSR